MEKERLIVGVSGASGMPLAIELLKQLKNQENIETHLIYSRAAEITLKEESDITVEELCQLADVVYDNQNIGAAPASGSFRVKGMIVVPCSMKTVAGIASGYSDSLLLRAADVMIKERRTLVLAVRECPFSPIHLRNMYDLSMMGVVILPMMMSFYNHPKELSDCVRHLAGKILDQFGIEGDNFKRWEGLSNGKLSLEKNLYGYAIQAEITLLKKDIHILITGGSLPHTGAVSMYCDGRKEGDVQPDGHRDKTVSDRWSRTLSEEFHCRVTTVCGIHYDNLTKEEIRQIVSATDELLAETVQELRNRRFHSVDAAWGCSSVYEAKDDRK